MRLFLALELPPPVRETLRQALSGLRASCPCFRFVSPDGIHVTLRFLGEVAPAREQELRGAWRQAVRSFPPLRLRIEGLGAFPSPSRPRVLWLGVREEPPAGTLRALAEALERAAREQGFPAEDRPFRPHLTLARARVGERPSFPSSPLTIDELVACGEVALVCSELDASPVRYATLDTFELAG